MVKILKHFHQSHRSFENDLNSNLSLFFLVGNNPKRSWYFLVRTPFKTTWRIVMEWGSLPKLEIVLLWSQVKSCKRDYLRAITTYNKKFFSFLLSLLFQPLWWVFFNLSLQKRKGEINVDFFTTNESIIAMSNWI